MPPEWLSRLAFLVKDKSRQEVDEELRFHLERQVAFNLAAGMTPEQARREATVAFGGQQSVREQCREQRPRFPFEAWWRDLRHGVRGLIHRPGFAIVAVLTISLAIGANAAVFSLLNQALVRALPVASPEELVVLSFAGSHPGHTESSGGNSPGHQHEFSYPMYRDLRDRNQTFSGLIASAPARVGVYWNSHSEAVPIEIVSGNYFQTLGVDPAFGRLFVLGDETSEGANPVAVLNFGYWKAHLSQAPVIGKSLLINGTSFTIVGVARPGFDSMVWGRMPAIYVPITMQRTVQPDWNYLRDHQSYWLDIVGRTRPGISTSVAEASVNSLFLNLRIAEFSLRHDQSETEHKQFIDASRLHLEAGAQGFSPFRNDVSMPLLIIMGMALMVVAMAVVNVSSLLLVRAATRGREFSMRYALGATHGQILRQLLAEGILLGIAGATIGLLIAPQALRLLVLWMSGGSPQQAPFSPTLDWRVLLFSIAATLASSLLFSLAPAAQFWNPRLADFLKQQSGTGTHSSLRFRRTCVALQIGFSLLLLVAAGLFVRTIRNLRHTDTGFTTANLVAFNLAPEMAGYTPSGIIPVEQRVLAALAALPGVKSAGATNDSDLSGDDRQGDVEIAGYPAKPDDEYDVELPWVSDQYLQTLGVPLIAGRYFATTDTASSEKVAVVNESLARHYFGRPEAALGHHIRRPHRPATDAVIVGVVRDVKHTSVRDPVIGTNYTLFVQTEKPMGLTFYVRTWQAPHAAEDSIRAAVANIDSKLIVSDLSTLNETIERDILQERTIALLASIFGSLATLLAGIGLYGILAYSTAQRTREIGIRMALGAQRISVVRLILQELLSLAGWTVLVTIPIAVIAARAIRSQLYGVSIADPPVYLAGVLVITLVAAAAGIIPSRRAASIDPARALRTD